MNTMLRSIVGAVLLAVPGLAQEVVGAAELARARVIEEQEGDLKAAMAAYTEVLNGKAEDGVKAEASLRCGRMLWRLGRQEQAKELLQKAVAAGGEVGKAAQAVLDGKDAQAQGEAEKAERAKALVERAGELARSKPSAEKEAQLSTWQAAWGRVEAELKWTGQAGARALAELLSDLPRNAAAFVQPDGKIVRRTSQLSEEWCGPLVSLLWGLGTPPAAEFFREVLASDAVVWRHYFAARCGGAADDLLPIAAQMLRDKDPDGEVQSSAAALALRFEPAVLFGALGDPLPQVQAAALDGLRLRWEKAADSEREQFLSQLQAPLRTALHSGHPLAMPAATRLLCLFASTGPRAARRLFLEELGSLPLGASVNPNLSASPPWLLDDAEAGLLAKALQRRGPCPDPRELHSIDAFVQQLMNAHQPEWNVAGIDAVLDVLELGYLRQWNGQSQSVGRFLRLASPAQLARFVRLAPCIGNAQGLAWLFGRELPVEVFPAVRDLVDGLLAAPTADADFAVFTVGPRNVRGVQNSARNCGPGLQSALAVAGNTGAPEAAAWLWGLVDRFPVTADDVARACVNLSVAGVGEPARAALRQLLVWPGTDDVELAVNSRGLVFAELVRVGDVPAIPLLASAMARGLGGKGQYWPNLGHPLIETNSMATGRKVRGQPVVQMQPNGIAGPVLACLISEVTPAGSSPRPWHGYDDVYLRQLWHALLQGEARLPVLEDLANITGSRRLPKVALPELVEALLALDTTNLDRDLQNRLGQVVRPLDQLEAASLVDDAKLRADVVQLISKPMLGYYVLQSLREDCLRALGQEVLAAVAAMSSPYGLVDRLQRAGLQPPPAAWLRWLTATPADGARALLLAQLPTKDQLDPALQRAVETAATDDPSVDVRIAACKVLGQLLSTDAVAPLLRALRDSDARVRAAATDALQAIRFYQEQRSHWQQVEAGVEVTKANATAKLVLQAKTGNKDQRLLAIRSLGVLAAPEALPYLIDWTSDADAEIAKAARDATAAIHQQVGAGK